MLLLRIFIRGLRWKQLLELLDRSVASFNRFTSTPVRWRVAIGTVLREKLQILEDRPKGRYFEQNFT